MQMANTCSGLDASIGFESGRTENLGEVFGLQGEIPTINFIDRTIQGVCEW